MRSVALWATCVTFIRHAELLVNCVPEQILTGFFAQKSVAFYDGIAIIPGGWLDHNWIQLGHQLADSCAGVGYSLVMTTIILWVMHFIPGCRLRTDEESEIIGIDDAEMGEFAYDYVAVDAELGPKAELAGAPDHGRGGAGNINESPSQPHSIEHEKVAA